MRSLFAILAVLVLCACTRTEPAEAPVRRARPAAIIIEDDRVTVTDAPRPRMAANAFSFAFRDDAAGNTASSGLTLRRAWLLAALADDRRLLPVLGVADIDAIAAERARLDAPGLTLAARAWFATGTVPEPAVRADLERALDAGSELLVGAAPVNDWVAKRTGVHDLVPEVDAYTRRVLVSTLVYRGAWVSPFPRTNTSARPFALAATKVDVPTMHHEGRLPFARSANASFVALPLGAGETFLFLAVPTRGTLAQLETELDAGMFERALAGLAVEEGIVELPRFRITGHRSTATLPPAYRDLASIADAVTIHEHVAIDVDEAGASAVAAAAVVTAIIASPDDDRQPRRLRVFRGDRPFLYWLVHARTSTILASGRVVDPR